QGSRWAAVLRDVTVLGGKVPTHELLEARLARWQCPQTLGLGAQLIGDRGRDEVVLGGEMSVEGPVRQPRIATLMADAGLTNGAFYAHFASKDDLVATAVADQLRAQAERLRALPPGESGLEQFVRWYLSAEHRDVPQDGCPSAALLDEIGRAAPSIKETFTDGLRISTDELAARVSPDDPQSVRAQVLSVFAMMAGTIQLSRALADRQLADEVLEQGIQNALALLLAHRN
ncbi:MAG TPA: TetR/AcrR family transcriptional regulator, partial [Mycobacterium sp.]|nr:TetR/AcrR family transcriptional regulator [Mycobacterium sp.]